MPGSLILAPSMELFDHLDTYFEKPAFDYQHILRFMDILIANSDSYLDWLYKKSNNVIPRDTPVIYYDCTNYYFEAEQPDEEVIDEVTGEILSLGLRQYGVSKEHRPNLIVEMGLMMDKRGIPDLHVCVHPGNTREQATAVPLEKEAVSSLNGQNSSTAQMLALVRTTSGNSIPWEGDPSSLHSPSRNSLMS